ncbi:Meiotic expression up-regulated protein 26 [Fusarium austroafricanum]|uniref:Meiotic expression up-regulated protein 26 n=1 Tax=Fusarium austroafricanum TaxID=2364996 RepID=A0A8H4NVH4_9HYPO|nr:Meiotic expression up-regulated protein 26 [Fusarium austroafricanum]
MVPNDQEAPHPDTMSVMSWGSSHEYEQTLSEAIFYPESMYQEFNFPTAVSNTLWTEESFIGQSDLHSMEHNMTLEIGNSVAAEVAIALPGSKPGTLINGLLMANDDDPKQRYMPGSSFSTFALVPSSNMPCDDFSAALSETPCFGSGCTSLPTSVSILSPTQFFPFASPLMAPQTSPSIVGTDSRGRGACSSPRSKKVRFALYIVDKSMRTACAQDASNNSESHNLAQDVYQACSDVYNHNIESIRQANFVVSSTSKHHEGIILAPTQLKSEVAEQQLWQADVNFSTSSQYAPTDSLIRVFQGYGDTTDLKSHDTSLSELYAAVQKEQILHLLRHFHLVR